MQEKGAGRQIQKQLLRAAFGLTNVRGSRLVIQCFYYSPRQAFLSIVRVILKKPRACQGWETRLVIQVSGVQLPSRPRSRIGIFSHRIYAKVVPMIAQLRGRVAQLEAKSLVLDVGGVGYRVAVLGSLLSKTKTGAELTLKIHHHFSSDSQSLFGFEAAEDQTYFELLLTVPSVGPRTAINILDAAPPRTLAAAVSEGDMKLLTKISGVGRKTAERILVELKGKIKTTGVKLAATDIQEETIAALTSIGYTSSQARLAAQALPKSVKTVEDAVRAVLKGQK